MNQATVTIVLLNITTIIEATNMTVTIADPTIVIETIDAVIVVDARTRTQRAQSPMTRRKRNHSKKTSNKAMHNNQTSLSSAGNLSGRRSRSCSRSPLLSCSCSRSCSCLSNRSFDNHHVAQDDRRPNPLLMRRYLYSSKRDNGGRIHRPDKSGTIFATFSAPIAKKGKRTQK